jgi:heptosyltransferase-3
MSVQNILIIQLRQLGDILLTTPCLRAAKEANPQHRVTFLTHSMAKAIIDGNPFCDEVIFYDLYQGVNILKLLAKLKRSRFDLVFDFMSNPRSAFFAWTTGAKIRVGSKSARSWAYSHAIPRLKTSLYVVKDKERYMRPFGFTIADTQLILPWSLDDLRATQGLRTQNSFIQAPVRIAIAATSRRPARRWPQRLYAKLADYLVQEKKAWVIWTFAPEERAYVEEIVRLTSQPTMLSPTLSIKELTAFYSTLDLFIGNSNGASHFAIAASCPSLQLHGPSDPIDWCPQTEKHQALQGTGGDVSLITLEQVIDRVEDLLQAPSIS